MSAAKNSMTENTPSECDKKHFEGVFCLKAQRLLFLAAYSRIIPAVSSTALLETLIILQ